MTRKNNGRYYKEAQEKAAKVKEAAAKAKENLIKEEAALYLDSFVEIPNFNCEIQAISSRVCELGTKCCVLHHDLNEDIIIECRCGKKWWIDYTPTPDECVGDIWRIWLDDAPGAWVDVDGNSVDISRG